jgi:hypothetical protein
VLLVAVGTITVSGTVTGRLVKISGTAATQFIPGYDVA